MLRAGRISNCAWNCCATTERWFSTKDSTCSRYVSFFFSLLSMRCDCWYALTKECDFVGLRGKPKQISGRAANFDQQPGSPVEIPPQIPWGSYRWRPIHRWEELLGTPDWVAAQGAHRTGAIGLRRRPNDYRRGLDFPSHFYYIFVSSHSSIFSLAQLVG